MIKTKKQLPKTSSVNQDVDIFRTNVLHPGVLGRYPSDPRDYLLDQLNVWVLEGCLNVTDNSKAQKIKGPMFSAGMMRTRDIAWRIDQTIDGCISWESAALTLEIPRKADIVIVFAMSMGMGDPLPQPSGAFQLLVNDLPIVKFHLVKNTEVWKGEKGRFCFQVKRVEAAPPGHRLILDETIHAESLAVSGLGILLLPRGSVPPGKPLKLTVKPVAEYPNKRWFRLDQNLSRKDSLGAPKDSDDYGSLPEKNYWHGLLQVKDKIERPRSGPYPLFFGDLHTHSGQCHDPERGGCGKGTAEDNYRYARDVSNLDFYALSEHEWQMPQSKGWDLRQELAETYCEDGRFVTMLSYEWGVRFGQRCVYYEKGGQPMFAHREEAYTPEDLWRLLGQLDSRVITVPHHPTWTKSSFEISSFNPEFDRLVETYSCWGNSEYPGAEPVGTHDKFNGRYVRDMLNGGLRMGIIASSDGHDGHPGAAQGTPDRHPQHYHHLGSGRVVVLAAELTRPAIFEALYQRRAYGTTGEPIELDFQLNGACMGSELRAAEVKSAPEIVIAVKGTNRIRRVCLIKDGQLYKVLPCDMDSGHWVVVDREHGGGQAYYYVRAEQEDGEMAWSSPIWII